MPRVRGLSLVWVVLLCHCGGEVTGTEPTGEGNASGGTGTGAGIAATAAGNGERAGAGGACAGSGGASAGELSAYATLRTACRLDLKVNRRGEPTAGTYNIK